MTERSKMIEAMARAECREAGVDPDEIVDQADPVEGEDEGADIRAWQTYVSGIEAALRAISDQFAIVPRTANHAMLRAGERAKIFDTDMRVGSDWIEVCEQHDLPSMKIEWPASPYDRAHEIHEQVCDVVLAHAWNAMVSTADLVYRKPPSENGEAS